MYEFEKIYITEQLLFFSTLQYYSYLIKITVIKV